MSESIPPLTKNDIRKFLRNPTFSVYIFIGDKNSEGWDNAELAHELIPRLRIYRSTTKQAVAEWTGGDEDIAGIVFGFDEQPVMLLGEVEVEDFGVVIRELLDARGES